MEEYLARVFTYHAPTPDQIHKYTEIRHEAKILAAMILIDVPEGREKALALTKLEEVVMWANAGIARA